MIPIFPGWNETRDAPPRPGVFAWHDSKPRLVEYYYSDWIPEFFKSWIIRHERAHTWGIKKCLSGSRTCLMAEDDDTWGGKAKHALFWLIGRGRFCPACQKYLNERIPK
jgi:hypothetical protein